MTWLEARVRKVLGESLFGSWLYFPRVPDGTPSLPLAGLALGEPYQVEVRKLEDGSSRVSEWAVLGTWTPEPGEGPPPATDPRVECSTHLAWEAPVNGPAPAGYEIRHAPEVWNHWDDMVPAHGGLWAGPPFPLCGVPGGLRTIAVQALSDQGVPSEVLYVQVHVREYDDHEPVPGRTEAADFTLPLPGGPETPTHTIENATETAGVFYADSYTPGDSQPAWSNDDYRAWLDDDAGAAWPTLYREVRYTIENYDPGSLNAGYGLQEDQVALTVLPAIQAGENWRTEYRPHSAPAWGDNDAAPAWLPDDDSLAWHGVDDDSPAWGDAADAAWGPDDDGPAWDQYPWLPWPGRLTAPYPELLDFRLVFPESFVRPELAGFALKETLPETVPGASELLDQVGEVPGSLLVRGPEAWELLPPGAEAQVFTAGPEGEIPGWEEPAPAGGGWQTIVKGSDQTGIGESTVDVSGLGIAVLAGQTLHFRAYLYVSTNAVTTGGAISVNGPSASEVDFLLLEWTSGTGTAVTMQTALDAFTSRTQGPGTTAALYEVKGRVTFTGSGTFIPRAHAESGSGGTMDVLKGSWIEYSLE